ncbi:MAG TPA: Arm DNA-binding domain-containing protein, partial [Methylococcaceae bacterium]|nr:Arm DNA-binding domain-containing protein [Methylococcaceae bacterium]
MAKLTDLKIRALIKAGDRFGAVSDGDGLYLCWPEKYAKPFWRFRYKLAGKPRVMSIGNYDALGLADARKTVKELRAQVALGRDPAGEKQERKAMSLAKIEEAKNARTVGQLADEYFQRMIEGKIKNHHILNGRIEKHIRRTIGKLPVQDVKPLHIDG